MKRFLWAFVFLIVYADAFCETIFHAGEPVFIDNFTDDEIIIESGAVINASYGNVISTGTYPTVFIENDGIINADIDTNGQAILIRNGGNINGTIIMGPGSSVAQIIKSDSDINSLNVSDGYDILVQIDHFNGVANLSQLKGLDNVGAFQIIGSDIIMDDFSEWQNWDAAVSLTEVNRLYINNPETIQSGEIIRHIVNPTNINVVAVNSENLYKITLEALGSGVRINIVRETDYDKVFENSDTNIFKTLRENHIDDRLLAAMDSASNIDELQRIMNSSYRFNHSILMQPVRAITNFSLMDIFNYEKNIEIKFKPSYVSSKNFGGYELRADVAGGYQDFYFDVGLFFDRFNYENDFNDFYGNIYGTDAKVKKYIGDFWVNGIAGFSLTDYNADYISVDNEFKNSPYGYALYGGIDGGYDYRVFDNFTIYPFIGGVFRNFKVLDFSEKDMNLRGGGNAKYFFDMDGIRYEYSAAGAIATNRDIFGMFKVGFISISDGAGVSIGLDVVKDDYAVNYRASLSGKITF